MNIVLSICIPTYNRCRFLKETLDCVSNLIRSSKHRDRIEFVVLDNVSTDDTSMILAAAKDAYSDILFKSLKNDVNIGGERNFRAVAKKGSGEYVWVLGDDDLLVEGCVDNIVDLLLAEKPVSLVLNYDTYGADMTTLKKSNVLSLYKNISLTDPEAVLCRLGPQASFISSIICRKDAYLALADSDYEQFITTGFPQMLAYYAGLKAVPGSTVLYAPIILKNRGNNSGEGYDWTDYFVVGMRRILNAVAELGYSKSAVNFATRSMFRMYFNHHLLVLKRDRGDVERFYSALQAQYQTIPFGTRLRKLIPGFVIRIPFALKKLIFRRG